MIASFIASLVVGALVLLHAVTAAAMLCGVCLASKPSEAIAPGAAFIVSAASAFMIAAFALGWSL